MINSIQVEVFWVVTPRSAVVTNPEGLDLKHHSRESLKTS
jgi:hypothetical protein